MTRVVWQPTIGESGEGNYRTIHIKTTLSKETAAKLKADKTFLPEITMKVEGVIAQAAADRGIWDDQQRTAR